MPGAQWTGIVTGIAIAMLEKGEVDAVVCVQSDPNDRWVGGGGGLLCAFCRVGQGEGLVVEGGTGGGGGEGGMPVGAFGLRPPPPHPPGGAAL